MARATKKTPFAPAKAQSLALALAEITEPKKLPPALAADLASFPDLVGIAGPLPRTATESVLRALLTGKLAPEKPLAAMLRTEATHDSRDALACGLLAMWERKAFHGRYDWVLNAVGSLAGDRASISLAAFIAGWPAQGDTGRKRAISAMPTLVAAGTDTAILELINLRQTMVVPSVLEAVIEALAHAVEDRKTTLSELFDVITPTLGLDSRGTRTFEHDGRALTVTFDDHLEPRLKEGDTDLSSLDDLPTWSMLAAQLRDAVKVQTFRLEQDMISGRRWDVSTWTRCLKEHPLLVTFAQRLVWGVYGDDGGLEMAFRTAEDRTLLSRDAEVGLPDDVRIGLVHPLHLSPEERNLWALNLSDYEIIQPFPQLGRTIFSVEQAEAEDIAARRFGSSRFKSGILRDMLVRMGWERDTAFLRQHYERTFGDQKVVAIATMDPGVQAGAATYDEADQTIPTIEFRAKKGRGKSTQPMALAEVPPIAFSEALLDFSEVLAAHG